MHDPDGEFWGDEGAGTILFSKESSKFLVGVRSQEVREPGTIGVFGGAIENGDNARETVEQEVMEELGYFEPLKMMELYTFQDDESGFRFKNFVSVIEKDFEPVLNWENDDALWLTLDELKDTDNDKLHFGLAALLDDKKSMSVLERVSNTIIEDNNERDSGISI